MIDFGHAPEPVTKVICARCSRDIDASGAHVPRWDEKAKHDEARQRAAIAAALRPYTGDIAQCQAGVMSGGRMMLYSRCDKRPTVIREVRDGLMAVCKTHGKAWGPSRYSGETNPYRGGPKPPANEPVP